MPQRAPLAKRNPFIRKGLAVARRAPRLLARMAQPSSAYLARPPVLVNSVPKSGTHLLTQVLSALPDLTDYGTFLASQPSVTFRQRSVRTLSRKIRKLAPGELASAHLFFDPRYERVLSTGPIAQFFIYRDPRDVAVSEAHYLTRMNRWHRLHRHYASLSSDDERITFAITGDQQGRFSFEYPDIGSRFRRYTPWIRSAAAFPIRFEDLAGPRQRETIGRVVRAYFERAEATSQVEPQVERCLAAVRPTESHTFRRGTAGAWRSAFTGEHRDLMQVVAGDLLVELGYESDPDWD